MPFISVTDSCACATQQPGVRGIEDILRATVAEAFKRCQGAPRPSRNVSLAVLSSQDQQDHFLYPEEENGLPARSGAKKKSDLALGRAAVRRALQDLGEVPFPVTRGEYGEPIWPVGFIGSITHCRPWTVALLIRAGKRLAIGIDLESVERVAMVDISSIICTPAEREWVRGGNLHEYLTMIFSAKEAVYKALHPYCRRYIDFKEVELSWLPQSQSFRVGFVGGQEAEFAGFGECVVLSRRVNELVFSCLVHQPGTNASTDPGLSPTRH